MIDLRVRAVALEGAEVKGRTVEAYAAVFDKPAEVVDQDGHYREEFDPKAFNKAISDNSQRGWPLFYNHAMTPHGTPSDRWSTPLCVSEEVRPDSTGLYTRAVYANTPDADHVLELIRAGAVLGYSFTGRFVRSTPQRTRSARLYRPAAGGALTLVRRLESTLVEFGPTPSPVHIAAEVLGVRAAALHSVPYVDTSGPSTSDTSGPSGQGTPTGAARTAYTLRAQSALRRTIK